MKEIVSIEKVLNSRCSCDFDGDPKKNHWGTFIKDTHPPRKILEAVLRGCRRTPQFSNRKTLFWFEEKQLFLGFEKTDDPFDTRLLHIESGMQHEAVYLACTALGVGTCIRNLGINGTDYEHQIGTARHQIFENEPNYREGRLTTEPPGPPKPFTKGGNLPAPRRNGEVECLPALERLSLLYTKGADADETDISQLLWAAKGRTPHYIKSHAWGLTIPTWGGGQNYTSVYLLKKNKLFRYINWTTPFIPNWWMLGRPIHDIKSLRKVNMSSPLDGTNTAIILTRNEETNRALWEVGYMLENMLLQTKSLGVSYRTKVFGKDEIGKLERIGISEAVATLLL